jgi:NAD(P)-dependent dehydrogenase (short-subunit alcohol dehydrogenase family)
MSKFTGKIVLVTGGASGIGLASAKAFASREAHVVIAGRRATEGQRAVDDIVRDGGRAQFIQTDVAKPLELKRLHERIVDEHGRLDIAFNNSGFQEPRAALVEQDPALFDRVFDVNVRALYLGLQHQIAIMLKQGGGIIIANTSVSGLRNPNPGLALYSASKAAAISLVRSAAMEYAPYGIRINAVAPGRVVTEMMLASKIADMSAVAAGLPIRRMGAPEEVAEAVVWLASDASAFVVGHVLCTDGGFMAA